MAVGATPKKSGGKKPAGKKAAAKRTAAIEPTASAEIKPATRARKRLPSATIRALKELEAGKLNRYADADELFQELDIKLGRKD